MSDKNFAALLKETFDNGTINFKHLETFLNSLIVKLDLKNAIIDEKSLLHSTKNDPLLKAIPSANILKEGLCKEDESNPFESMINVVNLTKRVEALEMSVGKLTSLMQTIISEQQRKEDGEEFDGDFQAHISKDVKELKSTKKECCNKNLSSKEFQTFGYKRGDSIKELPVTRTLPNCQFKRLEKLCKKESNNFANLCDLRELECHLKDQNDSIFSLINSNIFHLHQQICGIQKQVGKVEGQIDDVFFACEQNDEKIDDTISSMNDFNANIFCLKTHVKGLVSDSSEFKAKIVELNEKFETMNNVKTNKSYVDEKLKIISDVMYDELKKMVKIEGYEELVDAIRMRMDVNDGILKKLQEDVKKSTSCLKSSLDEKLNNEELKKFKELVGNLFDEFVKDLKISFYKISQNAISLGASKSLQTNLNCITCNSKVTMSTEFNELENSTKLFKNKLFKIKTPRKSLKSGFYCAGTKLKKKPPSCHQSILQFPPRSQQCFIVSRDNFIFKADPLKCLPNLNKSQ